MNSLTMGPQSPNSSILGMDPCRLLRNLTGREGS